jgi:hypothetical protein
MTHDESQVATVKNDVFSVGSWGVAMLELVRDPQGPHYSFSTWVRHDETVEKIGGVGIYFAHTPYTSRRGAEHILCTLSFNGRTVRRNSPDAPGNPVQVNVERQQETLRGGNLHSAGLPLYLPVSREDWGAWRKLAVEVSSEKLRFTVWRNAQFDAEYEFQDVPLQAIEDAWRDVSEPSAEVIPKLAFRGSLGLYVDRGFASFRNAVVKTRLD